MNSEIVKNTSDGNLMPDLYDGVKSYKQIANTMNIVSNSDIRGVFLIKKQNEELYNLEKVENEIKNILEFLGAGKIEASFIKDEYMGFTRMSVNVCFKEKVNSYIYKLLIKKLGELGFTLTGASLDVLGSLSPEDIKTYNDEGFITTKDTLEISEKMYLLLDSFVWSHNYKEERKKDLFTYQMQESDIACKTMMMFDIVMQERLFVMADLHKRFIRNEGENQDKYYKILSAILQKEKPIKPLMERTVGLVKAIMFYPVFGESEEEKSKKNLVETKKSYYNEYLLDIYESGEYPSRNSGIYDWDLFFGWIGFGEKATNFMKESFTIKIVKDDTGKLNLNLINNSSNNSKYHKLLLFLIAPEISDEIQVENISEFYKYISKIIELSSKIEKIFKDEKYSEEIIGLANIIHDYKEEFKSKSDLLELLYSCVKEKVSPMITEEKLQLFNTCKKIALFDQRFQEFYRLFLLSQKGNIKNFDNLRKIIPSQISVDIFSKYYSKDITSLLNKAIIAERLSLKGNLNPDNSQIIGFLSEKIFKELVTNVNGLLTDNGEIDKKGIDFKEKLTLEFIDEFSQSESAKGNKKIQEILSTIKTKKDIDNLDDKGLTILNHLILDGDLDSIKELVKVGVNINFTEENGRTPLMHAATVGCLETTKFLIESGADVNILNEFGENAFEIAEAFGNDDVAIYLLDFTKEKPKNKKASKNIIKKSTTEYIANVSEEVLEKIIKFTEQHNKTLAEKIRDTGDINEEHEGKDTMIYANNNGNSDIMNILINSGFDLNKKYNEEKTILMYMISNGYSSLVTSALKIRPDIDVDIIDKTGNNLLTYALNKGNGDLMRAIIDYGADVNFKFTSGKSILMLLTETGYINQVIYILKNVKDIDINYIDSNGKNLLTYAYNKGNGDLMRAIIDYGADVNFKYNNSGKNILMYLIESSNTSMATYILKNVKDINLDYKDVNGKTALVYAFEKGLNDVMKELILSLADLDIQYQENRTLPMLMTMNGSSSILDFIIQNRDDINLDLQDNNGKTLLMYMIDNGMNNLIIKLLQIRKGINIDLKNNNGSTALSKAYDKGSGEIIKALADAGADFDIKFINSSGGKTIPMLLANSGYSSTLEHIINTRIDIDFNIQDNYGKTLLMHLIENCQSKSGLQNIIKKLLEIRIDLNLDLADFNGKTALSLALEKGLTDIIKSLAIAGADFNMKFTDGGKTTLMKIACAGYKNTIDSILEKRNDIDLNIQDNYGKTLLMYMIENSLNDSIKKLLENNQTTIKLDLNDVNNKTALFYAIEKGLWDIVKALSDTGADLNIVYSSGKTILMELSARGSSNTLEYILSKRKDINLDIQDSYGKTLFMYMAENSQGAQLYNVLNDRFDMNLELLDRNGKNIMVYAIEKQLTDVIKILSDAGADLNCKIGQGTTKTILMYLISIGFNDTFKYIISSRTDIDLSIKDQGGLNLETYVNNSQNGSVKQEFEKFKDNFKI